MICPKCGFRQPDDYYCASCGVSIEKYVQKRKRRGYGLGIAIVLIGITAIAVTKYVQISHRTEEENISRIEEEENGSALQEEDQIESEVRPTMREQGPERKRVARRQPTKGAPRSSRSAAEALKEQGISRRSSEKAAEEKATSGQKEAPLTARQLFEKGMALDDDSELEIEFYQRSMELDSKFAPVYYRLGGIYYRRADYDRAEVEFVKFLQYASEVERLDYDIYLFYSDADVEALLERIKEAATASEETSEEKTPEVEAEETEESGPESSVETEQEVQTVVRFRSYKGQILVPVVLNGSVTADVLLDTGAGITIISTELARELGVKVARDRTIRLKTIASEVQAQLARLNSIELGDLSRDNFLVAVSDLELGEQRKLDGILGMDFLSDFAIQIDNKNGRILLSPGKEQ